MIDDLPDAPWITGGGGAGLSEAPWVGTPAVPSSPAASDTTAAYEQARDRWKATVERAKAKDQAQPQESAAPISGAMSPPTGMAAPMWGPFGSREGEAPPPSNALITRNQSYGKTLGRIGQYPGIAVDQIVDAFKLPGEVYQGKVDPYSPEGRERVLNAASVALPAGEFAGTGAKIARRAAELARPPPQAPLSLYSPTGQVIGTTVPAPHLPTPNPDYIAPSPGIEAAKTAADLGAPLPTGLVSENRATQALTQASRSLPLVGAKIDQRVGSTIENAGGAVKDIAENLSGGVPDRATAGAQLRPSLEGVIADNNVKIDHAYQSLRGVIDPNAVSPVPATAVALKRIMSERVASRMKTPESGLQDIINLTNNGASFDGLQRARADVGKIIGLAENNPNPGFNVGDFKRLYAAMSGDMERTVRANATVHPDVAASALGDANKVAADLVERNKNVQRLIGRNRPDEGIVGSIINAAQGKSGNARLLGELRAQMPKDDFEQIAGVALSELGHNPATGEFSLEKFGTAWRKLGDTAKSALFADPAHREALDKIANLDAVLKQSDKYINKSGTARAEMIGKAVAGAGALATAIMSGNVPVVMSTLAAGAGGYGLAKYLARPATASALRKWATVAQDQATGRYGTGKAALALASRNLMTNLRDVPGFNDAESAPAEPLRVTVPVGDKLAAP